MTQQDWQEKIKHQISNWKTNLEDLSSHFTSAGSADRFEHINARLKKQLSQMETEIEKLSELGDEKIVSLKKSLDELRVQLALGKAEGKEAFETQKENIEKLLDHSLKQYQELTQNMDKSYHQAVDNYKIFANHIKAQLDILQVQWALGKAEAEKFLAEKQKEIHPHMTELQGHLGKLDELREENWEHVRASVKEGFAIIQTILRKK